MGDSSNLVSKNEASNWMRETTGYLPSKIPREPPFSFGERETIRVETTIVQQNNPKAKTKRKQGRNLMVNSIISEFPNCDGSALLLDLKRA